MLELEEEQKRLSAQVARRRRPSNIPGYAMIGIGGLCLFLSAVLASTVLAFIGLGLTFWGAILLFIRPQGYVRSDLMDSTALSSLQTIDRLMTALGYTEKGIYVPSGNPEKAVVFVPSQPLSKVPRPEEVENDTFVGNPRGVVMVPPGLALANLIERELGVEFRKAGLENLSRQLPKLLIEDLEMVQDFDMRIDGNMVRFKFVESIYSDFCSRLRESTRVCSSLGCPFCSAMACIVAQASGKPVVFENDIFFKDRRTFESSYRILEA
jgi:hypothetical protein